MDPICEACEAVVFDRYGDGREVRNDGVALCPLHAAAPALLAALEAFLEINDGAYELTTGVQKSTVPFVIEFRGRVADFRAAYEAGRVAVRTAKGE